MGAPKPGEVVLIPFPYSDLSQSKVRPALCLANAGRSDFILCQITSSRYGDATALPIDSIDFSSGRLMIAIFVRPGKLFTAHARLIVRSIGALSPATFERVLLAVIDVLKPPRN